MRANPPAPILINIWKCRIALLIDVVFMGGGTGTKDATKVVSHEELGKMVQALKDKGLMALKRDVQENGNGLLLIRDPEGNSVARGLVMAGGTEFPIAILASAELRNDRNNAGKKVLEAAYKYGNDKVMAFAARIAPSLREFGGQKKLISHRDGYLVVSKRIDEVSGLKFDVKPVKGSILPSDASGNPE